MRTIKYIVLHCTAGPVDQSVKDILAYWKKTLGWHRPGYHHLITADGKDHELQPIALPSNGVAGYNSQIINISYTGGVKDGKPFDTRTLAQLNTMESLVFKYHAMFPEAKIVGHRDFSPDKNRDGIIQPNEWIKACPSFSVSEWIRLIRLVPDVTPLVVKKTVMSKGGVVNVRASNNISSAVLHQCLPGTAFIVHENKDGWSFGTVNEKISGWIRNDFLK